MGCGSSAGTTGAVQGASTLEFLSVVPLFKRLPKDLHPKLAECSQTVTFRPGKVVIRQGDEGNEFFVIKRGTADVMVDGRKVATLKERDYFGESALLRDAPRTATITVVNEVEAIKITRAAFQKFGLNEKLEFAKRGAVGGGVAEVEIKPPSEKTPNERLLMRTALQENKNLKTMVTLSDEKANKLIDAAWKEEVSAGTVLIQQGSLHSDYLYIVQEGSFDIKVADDLKNSAEYVIQNAASAEGSSVGRVTKGGCFGELGLLYFAPRAATVIAKENSVVWIIARIHFKQVLNEYFDQVIKTYSEYLDGVKILGDISAQERRKCATGLVEMTFKQNEVLFEQGEDGSSFYILIEGEVEIIKDGQKEAALSATTTKVCYFGETALIKEEPRTASVVVSSETARTLVLDRMSFQMLLGKGAEGKPPKEFGKIAYKDLKRLGLLGCGGFGTVELVEHTMTGETYALKGLSKGYIVKAGMQKGVMSEKNVQLMCDSPFIVQLYETYNSDQSLYLLLELALGGELYETYNRKGFWGRVDMAKYYIGTVLLAFEHMHGKKIIFRDLKPENVLLTDTGNAKVTDMGLAKVVPGMTYTTCGTPDYFAPELIVSKGHTKALDWWTLGVLTFELMAGHPPFEAASAMQVYQNVRKGIDRVLFPKTCKGPVEDLIKNLCHQTPTERLPMRKGETKNIKNHLWYKGFQWASLQDGSMQPPYAPKVKSKKDLANFSASQDDMPPQVPYKPDKSGWDKDFATST